MRVRSAQNGIILLAALGLLLAVSLLGMQLLSSTLVHEKLATRTRLDVITFQAAESAIDASIGWLGSDPALLAQMREGMSVTACLGAGGVTSGVCVQPALPLAATPLDGRMPALLAQTQSRFTGVLPIPGFAVDAWGYQQFVTRGSAHFGSTSALPHGYVNEQVWQVAAPLR